MLKAFDTIESEHFDVGIVDQSVFQREKDLILAFAKAHPPKRSAEKCVVCESSRLSPFAVLENVQYFRCEDCRSIFVPVANETATEYKQYEPLNEFRRGDAYQTAATIKRSQVWEELLFWIQFRAARFHGCGINLNVVDVGNHFYGLSNLIQNSQFCADYYLLDSILSDEPCIQHREANIVLYLDQLTRESDPIAALRCQKERMTNDGLLILSTRVGSGFDILTLREKIKNIMPYEHTVLPSLKGLELLLERAGLQAIELLTPGTLDVKYVVENLEALSDENLFVHDLLTSADKPILHELQTFLQKSGMSSHARVVAVKKNQ